MTFNSVACKLETCEGVEINTPKIECLLRDMAGMSQVLSAKSYPAIAP